MCSSSSKRIGGGGGGFFFFHLCLFGLLTCVHHSHQADNLPHDVVKGVSDDEHDHNGFGGVLAENGKHDEEEEQHLHEEELLEECLAGEELAEHGEGERPRCRPAAKSGGGGESDRVSDYRVWLAALLSMLIISVCGVFGVLVIPIMQKIFYQHLIQFLIALAVGTLAGDALLHLLPHALLAGLPHHHGEEGGQDELHNIAVWKGFVALMALIIFFLLEKLINAMGEWRERKKAAGRKFSKASVKVIKSGHAPSDRVVGEKVCKHKYSAYCVSDVESNGKDESGGGCTKRPSSDVLERTPMILTTEIEAAAAGKSEINNDAAAAVVARDDAVTSSSGDAGVLVDTVFIREHEHVHHGHSHAHSHLISKPESISSVAWMVIFGDGMHNLADGMAIGAAFSDSHVSGMSTSIAVLCHELPHEIGDFAMLLKAGMSVKQAIVYNLLSSFLGLLGMICGLLLGNLENWSTWIFCATAGVFLYVALVDMIPELNSGHAHPSADGADGHPGESQALEVGLQVAGMSIGALIMLLIAVYEENLKTVFA